MNIAQMHVWFRQYAQQMGMQNVRAILPEQIDNLINTSTLDVIDEIVKANVGTTNDRVITDNAKLSSINALRTLHRVSTYTPGIDAFVSSFKNDAFAFNSTQFSGKHLYYVDFSVRYKRYGTNVNTRWFPIRIIDDSYLADVLNDWVLSPRLRTPIMVIHGVNATQSPTPWTGTMVLNTSKYEYNASTHILTIPSNSIVRLYEASDGNKIYDYIDVKVMYNYTLDCTNLNNGDPVKIGQGQQLTSIFGNAHNSNAINEFEIYFGDNDFNDNVQDIADSMVISDIRCSYIKKPDDVQYLSDVGGSNVNSDLPEQLQIPMLKHAVDLYRISIQGSLYANQQNAQQNQQEMVRNNARPDNEGYQS